MIEMMKLNKKLLERALQIHKETIVVDTHCDITKRIVHQGYDIGKYNNYGHFDIPRARKGGLDAVVFSICLPYGLKSIVSSSEYGLKQIRAIYSAVDKNSNYCLLAKTAEDIVMAHRERKIAILLGIEDMPILEENLSALQEFHRLGVRIINLSYSNQNIPAKKIDSVINFVQPAVKEMDRLGIIIDLAHMSSREIENILKITTKPIIISHTACGFLCPSNRNIDDDMIYAIAQKGGLINIYFSPFTLIEENWQKLEALWPKVDNTLKELNNKANTPEVEYWQEMSRLVQSYEFIDVDISIIVDHIEHIIQLVGNDYVGIGSDFDGIYLTPKGLEDVSKMYMIAYTLLERGYDEETIRKILGMNFLRIIKMYEN